MSRAHTKIFDKVIQSVICFIHWVTTITCTYRAHRAQPKYIVQHYRPIYFIASNLFDVCIHSILAQWHSRRIDELVSHFIPFVAMHAATRRLNYNFFFSPTTKAIWRLFRLQCNWRIIKKIFLSLRWCHSRDNRFNEFSAASGIERWHCDDSRSVCLCPIALRVNEVIIEKFIRFSIFIRTNWKFYN